MTREGDLSADEMTVLKSAKTFLEEVKRTRMVKCFKMVVLDFLLAHDALLDGMPVARLAALSHAWTGRSPDLFRDIRNVRALPNPRHPEARVWPRY